jgi:ceramide glucosyltransferase
VPEAPAQYRPPITLVRPLCGLEHFSRETLGSTFAIEYPDYEILFCVADANDPILPLARAVVAEHAGRDARILVGDDAIGANPKLNNMAKGFRQSKHEHIVFVDSNVYTPPGYLDQLMAALQDGAGMVSAPPVGYARACNMRSTRWGAASRRARRCSSAGPTSTMAASPCWPPSLPRMQPPPR